MQVQGSQPGNPHVFQVSFDFGLQYPFVNAHFHYYIF